MSVAEADAGARDRRGNPAARAGGGGRGGGLEEALALEPAETEPRRGAAPFEAGPRREPVPEAEPRRRRGLSPSRGEALDALFFAFRTSKKPSTPCTSVPETRWLWA